MTLRQVMAASGLLGVLATSLPAQEAGGAGYVWAFRDVTFSACVDFLMDRELAEKQLAPGFQLIPAGSFTALSPVLRREVEGDSAGNAMIAAQLCVIEAPTMNSGEGLYSPTQKMGMQEAVAYWAIAATRAGGVPNFDRWFVVEYWTNDWRVRKQTEAAFVPVSTFKRSFVAVPESNPPRLLDDVREDGPLLDRRDRGAGFHRLRRGAVGHPDSRRQAGHHVDGGRRLVAPVDPAPPRGVPCGREKRSGQGAQGLADPDVRADVLGWGRPDRVLPLGPSGARRGGG